MRLAFVTECLDFPTTRVRALAYFDRGSFVDDVEYDLAGTPCEKVIREGAALFCPSDLAVRFPGEAGLGLTSYYGVPISDSDGRVIGHLAFLDEKQMDEGILLESIYKIFTARAGAELIRRQMTRTVSDLVAGLSESSGEEALSTLVKSFASVMGVREAFVTECHTEDTTARLQVVAWWRDGRFESGCEYSLAGSVCEETVRDGKLCFYPGGVSELFPPAHAFGRESYLGLPCRDAAGRVVGHIACCHDRPWRRELPDEAILQLYAERASAALQRRSLARAGRPDPVGIAA